MPTQRQIDAQSKRDASQFKRDAVTHVSDTAMRILHNSSMHGTTLWPKKGFSTVSNAGMDLNDVIQVNPVFKGSDTGRATGTLLFILLNLDTKFPRIKKQQNALELIFDCTIQDQVYFEHLSSSCMGLGMNRLFAMTKFDFSYTPTRSI